MIAKAGLQNHVQILENLPQQEVFEHYKKSNVFLFPSLHDSSGSVLYEAMSFSLPVVTLNLNGPGFIMGSDYDSVVNIEKSDNEKSVVNKLSEKLAKLYKDPDYYNSLSRSALHKAEHLTWKNIVASVYTKIEHKYAVI